MPSMKALSVGESSTTMIFLIAMCVTPCCSLSGRALLRQVGLDRLEQAFLGEGFREVFVGADHAAARAVEEAVLGGKHDHRRRSVLAAFLDERARLVAVQARHHDVHE